MMTYVYGAMLIASLVLIYIAIQKYNETRELLAKGIKAKAEVVDLIEVSDEDGSTYKPVFVFTDKNNKRIRFTSDVSSSPSPYDIGDLVPIVYELNGYERKVISYWGLYRSTIIFLCIAAPLLIIGGGYLLYING